MVKLRTRMGRVTLAALAALALTLSVLAARAQQQPATGPAPPACASSSVSLTSSAPKSGDELTATVRVESCSEADQKLTLRYTLTDACGEQTKMGATALRVEAGQSQEAQLTMLAPNASSCGGQFEVRAAVTAAGKEVSSSSANFSVQ